MGCHLPSSLESCDRTAPVATPEPSASTQYGCPLSGLSISIAGSSKGFRITLDPSSTSRRRMSGSSGASRNRGRSKGSSRSSRRLPSSPCPTKVSPIASRPTALASRLVQFYRSFRAKMASGTPSPSSRNRSRQSNGTTRSTTQRC